MPALVFSVGLTQIQAEATSLLAIVPVSLVGAANQHRYGNLDLRLAGPIALGSIPGALIGVAIVNLLPIRLVEILFGLLLLWIAQRLLRRATGGRATGGRATGGPTAGGPTADGRRTGGRAVRV